MEKPENQGSENKGDEQPIGVHRTAGWYFSSTARRCVRPIPSLAIVLFGCLTGTTAPAQDTAPGQRPAIQPASDQPASNPGSAPQWVTSETGDLPVILSAPHGGRAAIPDVPPRSGDGIRLFRTVRDTNTDRLAEDLADALERHAGKRPYVVIARFSRKSIDANRRASDAYESPAARPIYDRYHHALAAAKQDIADRFGRGLLLDLHGQAAEPDAIFRGTQNGATAKHLVDRFGAAALRGPHSLFGRIHHRGIRVIPAVGSDAREASRYDGGYIVRHYGSGRGGHLDAIQLELGRSFRTTPTVLNQTADSLAAAITEFAERYLPTK